MFKGWRTVLFNAATIAVGITNGVIDVSFVEPSILLAVNTIGNLILRYFTTTTIGQNGPTIKVVSPPDGTSV